MLIIEIEIENQELDGFYSTGGSQVYLLGLSIRP